MSVETKCERLRCDRRAERQLRRVDDAADPAEVAEDEVVAAVAVDRVAAPAAEHDVVAAAAVDRVAGADRRARGAQDVDVRKVGVSEVTFRPVDGFAR